MASVASHGRKPFSPQTVFTGSLLPAPTNPGDIAASPGCGWSHNSSFKPTPHRGVNSVLYATLHAVAAPLWVGLTQALARNYQTMKILYLSRTDEKTDVLGFMLERIAGELNHEFIELDSEGASEKDYLALLVSTIESVDLIVANVSGQGANISMEVGAALFSRKPLLPVFQSDKDSPGSLMLSLQHVAYKSSDLAKDVSDRLKRYIEGLSAADNSTTTTTVPPTIRHKVFISYSHADRNHLDRLLVHLKPIERAEKIEMWSDIQIRTGDRWKSEIEEALNRATIAVLLLSADFMASDFITKNELPPLLKNAEEKGTRIIPLIVKPCRFLREPMLSQFQSANIPSRPLVLLDHGQQEEILDLVATEVERHVAV